jgi:hypothetical protein
VKTAARQVTATPRRRHRKTAADVQRRACTEPAQTKPRLVRKGLAVADVRVVMLALRKPTVTRLAGMSRYVRRHRTVLARLKGCRESLSCIAKAVRIPDPIAPNDHASRRSIWR